MERYDWDAEAKAADMRDMLLLDNCCIPVYEENGTKAGYEVRVAEPETRKIDEGIVQLSFSFEVYFHPGQSHEEDAENVYCMEQYKEGSSPDRRIKWL